MKSEAMHPSTHTMYANALTNQAMPPYLPTPTYLLGWLQVARGALDLRYKTARHAMTPLDHVFMMSAHQVC